MFGVKTKLLTHNFGVSASDYLSDKSQKDRITFETKTQVSAANKTKR